MAVGNNLKALQFLQKTICHGICIMKKGDVSSLRTISCLAEGITTDKPVIDVQGQQNINGVEAASTVTENGFVLEAKHVRFIGKQRINEIVDHRVKFRHKKEGWEWEN